MRVKLSRHGNSLGFVVPAALVREAGLEAGLEYELELEGQGLSLRPVRRRRSHHTASELLRGLPDGKLAYEDLPEYAPVGREWPE